jgi:hypothetical protein
MSSSKIDREVVADVQKTVHDAKGAENGSKRAMGAMIDDVQNEERKFKSDPAKLAAYKAELNKELHAKGLLLPNVEIIGSQRENYGQSGLELKTRGSTAYVGRKDQDMLDLLDGRTDSLLHPVKH